ncbi:Succinylglutamate desuccinylase / Aspartoacylase family protein [Halogranum amylolyticum]|uniref:Succinylglutamate desuccinylase / Aspartoacylase family protein n=1 Tax=Halogranum amylolyticum TaxID=660520 RepID=A0A1H8MPJ7_9EURY|nr:succinylglutamate desuccinylase/aspartoacylase family protein [Halogranum amylolyticum]SEO19154.1 Succinylglutamate desuccinylase / Aspartoacylase family protein [Halogranum amylolyticum]
MVTSSYSIRTDTPHETDVYVYDSGQSGPTTMVVGGIHGNEPSGYRAATQIASWGVDRGKLVVLPRANEVAISRNSRYDDDGDLNRKFPPLSGDPETPLAQAIWKQVVKHDPDWMFDLHSARGIYKSGDGSVGQALFPTWTSPAREYGENTVADLNTEFGFTGDMRYLMGNTLDADRPMLMHRVAGMLDIPGYICETTRKDTTTSEQINWHLFCVEHVMNQYGQERVPQQSSVDYSAGMVTLDDYWQEFDVSDYYSHPAIVAPALSYNGRNPAHVRISGLTGSSFEARIEEWPYLDGSHTKAQAGYLMLNPGTYSTTNGRRIEVGRAQVNHEWESVSFENSFSTTPVLFAMPQTTAGSDPIVARIQNASPSGFQYRVQEQDAERATEYHYEEVVSWMAFEPGRGSLGSRDYEANTTIADDSWQNIQFSRSYQNPTFIADVMSYNGWNSTTIRWRNLTSSGVDLFIEEEQSADKETRHRDETVSYFVTEG